MKKNNSRDYLVGAPQYSENTRKLIKSTLQNLRIAFRKQLEDNKLDGGGCNGLVLGRRFESDNTVIWRLESTIRQHEFLENPIGWIWETLFECAAADHWYEYEKKY